MAASGVRQPAALQVGSDDGRQNGGADEVGVWAKGVDRAGVRQAVLVGGRQRDMEPDGHGARDVTGDAPE
jgi:hypothetical protein